MNTLSPIDCYQRQAIERERLLRIYEARTREPSTDELAQYERIVAALRPRDRAHTKFVGMQAVTLTRNADIDLAGYGSLKADGMHAHLAYLPRTDDGKADLEAPHFDVALLVTRDERVRAIDGVQIHAGAYGVLLDGELCLRKRTLTLQESQRIKRACNVHAERYIDYPSDADADARDACSTEHQARYDEHWDLVYAAFDCMYVVGSQMNRPYAERVKLAFELLETPTIVSKSVRYARRAQRIQEHMERAAARGLEKPALAVFVKPTWRVFDAAVALHAPPHCLHGVPLDGVVFTPNSDPYVVGTSARVLKWKPENTLDVLIGAGDCLFVQRRGQLEQISDDLELPDDAARALAKRARETQQIVECVGVRAPPTYAVRWRPVLLRAEKRMPNSFANYQGVRRAVSDNMTEQALKEWLVGKIGASGVAMAED